jgi:hypothetical protein
MEVKPVVNGEVRTGVAALTAVAGGPQGAAGGKRTRLGMGPWGFFFAMRTSSTWLNAAVAVSQKLN